jgi:DNA polymerase-4
MRKIIHIDMDAFFASVEQRDQPDYRGRPLIVGGPPDSRGVVAACSYEARRFGIHSAMPSSRAYRLCSEAIFVRPRFEAYRAVSADIHQVFQRYTSDIEPLSLDEAYLDVSALQCCGGSATLIARRIKAEIHEATGLIASAGVSYNKFLAKIASDMDKPDGLFVITPAQGPGFVADLAIGKFHGIGKATEAKMKSLGIHSGADLRSWSLEALLAAFGKVGGYYYQVSRGDDPRPVVSQRRRKSIGAETTFADDIADMEALRGHLMRLADRVLATLEDKGLRAQTLTVKVKYANFEQVTRSRSSRSPLPGLATLSLWLYELLERTDAGRRKVRLLGVSVSRLTSSFDDRPGPRQLELALGGCMRMTL